MLSSKNLDKFFKNFTLSMVFKTNMIVIMTAGRHAGMKAVVVKKIDENTLLVSGVARCPTESEDYLPSWQKRKNEKLLTFVKKVNVRHVLATRYKADIGLTEVELTEDIISNPEAKMKCNESANKILREALNANKAKWLFTPLRFN
jgi:large subunit ribosomal protein L27e